MRIALAVATAAALISTPVIAAPYTDVGNFATFSLPITVDGPVNPTVGSAFVVTMNGTNDFGTEEFEAVNGFTSGIGGGFTVTASVGGANIGQLFDTDYDRTGISDPASPPGSQTGTLTFVLGTTTNVQIGAPGPTQAILVQGLLLVGDGAGFYDDDELGSWSFAATVASASGSGFGSITVSVPPSPGIVSEPAMLALAGVGLLGLAAIRRHT